MGERMFVMGALAVTALVACGGPVYGTRSDQGGEDDSLQTVGGESAPLPVDAGRDASSPDAFDASLDAAPREAAVDASTTQTFTVGTGDCGGGHCSGGYDGVKDAARHLATATKQCVDRAFARATDFTIGGQPGGRFCDYNGTSYGCDSSCDGCNIMTTVTCVK